ncbi:MAG: hypothetical protein ABGZ53_28135 [Fuerstiella sp.]
MVLQNTELVSLDHARKHVIPLRPIEECVRPLERSPSSAEFIGTSAFSLTPRPLFDEVNRLSAQVSGSQPFRFDTPFFDTQYVSMWCPWTGICRDAKPLDSFYPSDALEGLKTWRGWFNANSDIENIKPEHDRSNGFKWPPVSTDSPFILDPRTSECATLLRNLDSEALASLFAESSLAFVTCIDQWMEQLSKVFETESPPSRFDRNPVFGRILGRDVREWTVRPNVDNVDRERIEPWFACIAIAFKQVVNDTTALRKFPADVLDSIPPATFRLRGDQMADGGPLTELLCQRDIFACDLLIDFLNVAAEQEPQESADAPNEEYLTVKQIAERLSNHGIDLTAKTLRNHYRKRWGTPDGQRERADTFVWSRIRPILEFQVSKRLS